MTASMQSTAMHLALATELEENFFVDRVEKVIHFSPCTGFVVDEEANAISNTKDQIFGMDKEMWCMGDCPGHEEKVLEMCEYDEISQIQCDELKKDLLNASFSYQVLFNFSQN